MKTERNVAIIRLRGRTGINKDIALTLELMKLERINNCLVARETPELMGMVRKAKDYITWGIIDDSTLKAIAEKRKAVELGERKLFKLNPPRGGLGPRGIKASFGKSGALGERKEKINDLLKRMI
ncbi:uL30 family ribosomal protein [Candidatus Woesearchaeota archaeon]|nr:uL30 family ribosomal protein [Candidatus Woesearchaeota archaeon]